MAHCLIFSAPISIDGWVILRLSKQSLLPILSLQTASQMSQIKEGGNLERSIERFLFGDEKDF
jgi:hypothetical protein